MHTTPEYIVTVFFADEDGCPFTHGRIVAVDDTEAKAKALQWLRENKPQHYRAVKIQLRRDEAEIWSSPIDDHGFPVSGM